MAPSDAQTAMDHSKNSPSPSAPAGRGNFGERQEAGRRDWGFHAHQSIYEFAAGFVAGRRCLEIGCGTGYGLRRLLEAGATEFVAIDKDAAVLESLRAALPDVDCRCRDLDIEGLGVAAGSCDLVFSSNVFEHLTDPDRIIAEASAALTDDGLAIIAVPPVTSVELLAANARNIFHVTNIPPRSWAAKLARGFHEVRQYRHWVVPRLITSTGDLDREAARQGDFTFATTEDHDIRTITAIFVARRPRRPPLAVPQADEGCPPAWRAAKVEADARQAMVMDLKRQLAEMETWARENRAGGIDPAVILDGICRQLAFLTGREPS
jgi:SAM-dependent methyltransferase